MDEKIKFKNYIKKLYQKMNQIKKFDQNIEQKRSKNKVQAFR